jgi:RNA polymerase sigma factor (sigma-70 family)
MNELAELAAAAQTGDAEAYAALIQRCRPMAHRIAYRCLKDYHLAQDLVQEAAIEAFICLPRLKEPAAFPGWFRQIVFRQCTRVLRQTGSPCTSLDGVSLSLVAESSSPEELAVRDETWTCVLRAVAELPAHERLVIVLFYGRQHSYGEVSAYLKIPITTIKKRLHSARQRLRAQLQPILRDEIAPRSSDGAEIEGAGIAGEEINGEEIEALAPIVVAQSWNTLIACLTGTEDEHVYLAAA